MPNEQPREFDPRYDYEELSLDLYWQADELLNQLVGMRQERGLTQAELAKRMGVTQSYVSQIETGRKDLVELLGAYAVEVGARVTYVVEPAEESHAHEAEEFTARPIRARPENILAYDPDELDQQEREEYQIAKRVREELKSRKNSTKKPGERPDTQHKNLDE
ncbi:helix-turn-helix transcriptional regulator [Bombiscardovia apis]|nr:helix-turn-helix transcriptional regulator [Bombiscardovia apis]